MLLVIAEKPSVARDLAQALGVKADGRHFFKSDTYYITWAVGHLVTLAEPHEINPLWKQWSPQNLPMLPDQWPLTILERTAEQFEQVKKLLNQRDVHMVIAATDAGREGELIFRYIYEKAGCTKPAQRLWLSSLTQESIRDAFKALRPISDFNRLADNARGRSRSDWLVGLNLSRAYALKYQERWTVGRVQTPTLAMVVERTEAIQNFVPEPYCEIEATFKTSDGTTYRGLYFEAKTDVAARSTPTQAKRFKPDDPELHALLERATTGVAKLVKRDDKEQKIVPPKLYDLTELQKDANRLFGFNAKMTLDVAQSLYEKHKLITYPRSDSRYLSQTVAKGLPEVVTAIRSPYESYGLHERTGVKPLGRAFVDDTKVSDHHAIIPTGKMPRSLTQDETKIFDLIVRRLLMAWQDDHVRSQSTIHTEIKIVGREPGDSYRTFGSVVLHHGWQALEVRSRKSTEAPLLPAITVGQNVSTEKAQILNKETKPPLPFTDATLLNGMASAGSKLDDRELTDILRDHGLGTPATRAAIIETLISRHYMERRDKGLWATENGIRLIKQVHPSVRSAALTGAWEAKLRNIEAGKLSLETFMNEISTYVTNLVMDIKQDQSSPLPHTRQGASRADSPAPHPNRIAEQEQAPTARMEKAPAVSFVATDPAQTLQQVFGHRQFRTHQEQICREIIAGNDLLLVMPTGAGKSLCYQLPALMRPGSTLVISPLVALMKDQVAKLQELGIPAAALYAGMAAETSRDICRNFMTGHLKLLYIAPERLGIKGFLEFLAKCKPGLIAIDEAHCISQWGHDFRPDYRMLAQRLAALRPAPVVAMTATATPLVQEDIRTQLDLRCPKLHIHGFRRENLGIEVSDVPPPVRSAIIRDILKRPGMTPAIVYAPTRKETENLAEQLADLGNVAAYHAGMNHKLRERVQEDFQAGRVEVMIATVAFGMGIDKGNIRTVIHAALPSSVEAYYQEIGRAGRDGQRSRAILLHSYADQKTRDFFLKKNYPDISVLKQVLSKIKDRPLLRTAIRSHLEPGELDNALEKLWIHGAIELTQDDHVVRLQAHWEESYLAQQAHKENEVKLMQNFAQNSRTCRMLQFLEHFGDKTEQNHPCKLCDICAPEQALTKTSRAPNAEEKEIMAEVQAILQANELPMALGRLLHALGDNAARRDVDACLAAMVAHGLIHDKEDSFTKDGKVIHYRKLSLQPSAATFANWDSIQILGAHSFTPLAKAGRKKSRSDSKRRGANGVKKTKEAVLDSPVMQKLRGWRLRTAKKERVPAYRVFSDRILEALAEQDQLTLESMGTVSGIGPVKLKKYAEEILHLLKT